MTLVIYFPCKDGCILVSDKQESYVLQPGLNYPVSKYFLSPSQDYAISGSGDPVLLERFFYCLNPRYNDEITGDNVDEKVDNFLKSSTNKLSSSTEDISECILITRQSGKVMPYFIILSSLGSIRELEEKWYKSIGDKEAIRLANYLLKKSRYVSESLCKDAILNIAGIMGEVAYECRTVGRLEDYGCDIVVFYKDSGKVEEFPIRGSPPKLKITFG